MPAIARILETALYVDDLATPISTNDTYTPPSSGASEVRIGAFYTGPEAGEVRVAFDQLVIHRNK